MSLFHIVYSCLFLSVIHSFLASLTDFMVYCTGPGLGAEEAAIFQSRALSLKSNKV